MARDHFTNLPIKLPAEASKRLPAPVEKANY
jgi:hypothetical protein